MVAPQGKRKLEQFLAVLMDDQGGAGLSPRMIVLVLRMVEPAKEQNIGDVRIESRTDRSSRMSSWRGQGSAARALPNHALGRRTPCDRVDSLSNL